MALSSDLPHLEFAVLGYQYEGYDPTVQIP